MAIGLALMVGFHFPQNFDHPYISRSISEFWRRWHMSLSRWFRDYLYIPLGGNRHGPWTTARNLLLVFFLCGLWHGAAWTFVLWGLYHGLFLALERAGLARLLVRLPLALRHVYALLVVLFGWVLFRADGIDQAGAYWAAMLGAGTANGSSSAPTNEVLFALAIGLLASTPLAGRIARLACEPHTDGGTLRAALVRNAWLCGLLGVFVLAAARLATDAYNPFIYFRF